MGLLIKNAQHKVVAPPIDDGKPIVFEWHFPRGTFDERMSALELSTFLLSHMPNLLPFLSGYPRAKKEFEAMTILLATSPKEALDRLLPWIRSVTRREQDDLVVLSLFSKEPQKAGKLYFDFGKKS